MRGCQARALRDATQGTTPPAQAAVARDLELIRSDADEATIEVAFAATDDFATPGGDVREDFLAAMLHYTLGPALLAALEPHQFISTLHLNTRFLRPAYPGRLIWRGRLLHHEGDLASLEGVLENSDHTIVATVDATARVIELDSDHREGDK